MEYRFFSPAEIRFGWGTRREIGTLTARLGSRAWIVLGSRTLGKSQVYQEVLDSLNAAGIHAELLTTISREPEVSDVDRTTADLLERTSGDDDFLIALGGGAAIDLAKAAAAMATNRESHTVKDYLEGVGRGFKIKHSPLPMVAMPTTSGTGSEATKNAVISSYDPPFKKSLRSDLMIPDVVVVDPELTVTMPETVTAYSGMDAVTQCIESYISRRSKPIPQALALQGVSMALASLEEAVKTSDSRVARERMAHAALLSGLALANSGLGMAHGVAAALGVHCRVPHGLACAVMLPVALRVNQDVSQARILDLAQACGHLTEDRTDEEVLDEFLARIDELAAAIGIPSRLSQLGVTAEALPAIVTSSYGNSMSGNPRELGERELQQILEAIL